MKRLIALVLSLVMALSLCTPAWGAGEVAEVGGTQYTNLQDAIDAAELVGGTVTLLDDVTLSLAAGKNYCLLIDAPITLDGDGHALTFSGAYDSRAISITTNGNVTIKDLTLTTNGERGIQVASFPVNLTLENVIATSANYTVNMPTSAGAAKVAINDCELTGLCTINVWGAGAEVTIDGGKIVCNDQNDAENYRALNLNSTATGATITATGVTFDIKGGSSLASNATTDGEILIDGSDSGVKTIVASVPYGDYAYLFPTVQDAIDHAVANSQAEVVVLETAINSGEAFTPAEVVSLVLPEDAVIVSNGAGAYLIVEKSANAAEVEVAAPEVSVDTTGMTTTEANIATDLKTTGAVALNTNALTAQAANIANNNSVTQTQGETKLEEAGIPVDPSDEVVIVVQPYYDVAIKDVVVEESGASVSSVTIELDITPKYQTVATTKSVVDSSTTEIKTEGNDQNAVVIDTANEMTITEPVEITIAIPDALAQLATSGKLYVTHKASSGTYVYEATVAGTAGAYTATFTNPHGFSSFTLSIVDDTVAEVGSDKYTNLQDAINNAGKDATIVLKKDGQSAVVRSETSFTVELDGATVQPTIYGGMGYDMTIENVTGGVKYTFTKVTGGYYYPTTSDKLVESAKTADPIALYFGVTALATLGSALLAKKKED